jgi:hypothetical protein
MNWCGVSLWYISEIELESFKTYQVDFEEPQNPLPVGLKQSLNKNWKERRQGNEHVCSKFDIPHEDERRLICGGVAERDATAFIRENE